MKQKKHILTAVLVLAISLPVNAAWTEYFEAVMKSDAYSNTVGRNTDILSIKHKASYRCPGCYDFAVRYKPSGESPNKIYQAIFQTNSPFGSDAISVKLQREPKVSAN